jgi:hypothetical protein
VHYNCHPNKLLGVLILEMESNIYFDIINAKLEVEFFLGLEFVFANTNVYGRKNISLCLPMLRI